MGSLISSQLPAHWKPARDIITAVENGSFYRTLTTTRHLKRGSWKIGNEGLSIGEEAWYVLYKHYVLTDMEDMVRQGSMPMDKLISHAFISNGGDWHKRCS